MVSRSRAPPRGPSSISRRMFICAAKAWAAIKESPACRPWAIASKSRLSTLLFACAGAQEQTLTLPADPKNYAPLEKYEAMKIPAENAMTQEKATLGWMLWFDKRLSGDGKLACCQAVPWEVSPSARRPFQRQASRAKRVAGEREARTNVRES